MADIIRDPAAAASREYDLIVVGGGIYGAMLALEAAGAGLETLLLERADFGGQTSFNSLRILHGGLRYLQSLNLGRFFESVRERRWYLRHFPDLAAPLPCLMPLYARGLRRNGVLRVALAVNDLLSLRRNVAVDRPSRLPSGRMLDRDETLRRFPRVSASGLTGAALWHDASFLDSPRVVMEVLRWAASRGATALNYVEVDALLEDGGASRGVGAWDRVTGERLEFRAPAVVNAAGPWCRALAQRLDRDEPRLFRPSIAWNLLLEGPALSDHALALTPERPGGPTYFVRNFKGRCLIGTGHALWDGDVENPRPGAVELDTMLGDLQAMVPGLDASELAIRRVFAGLLPAVPGTGDMRLIDRATIVDHGREGRIRGLFSVSGVKFTTARGVALKVLRAMAGTGVVRLGPGRTTYTDRPTPARGWQIDGSTGPDAAVIGRLSDLARRESVVHVDDLIFRRTTIWEAGRHASPWAARFCEYFYSDAARRSGEMERLNKLIDE